MTLIEKYTGSAATIILSLAIILFSGFLLTRITKKLKLPNVTGYILSGVLIGPYVLHLIPTTIIEGMDFVTDIALAYIAFGVGKYFKFSKLRRSGKQIFIITMFESLMAALVVSLTMIFVFHLSISFSLLLGAISSATAPASTIMTIRQYHAKGVFVNTILQVVALDDAVSLIAFSICAAIANALQSGTTADLNWQLFVTPLALNLLVLVFGVLCGYLLKWIISDRRSREHRLVLINAVIFLLTGICTTLHVSPLLSCMVMGTVYINIIGDRHLFKEVNHFTPPIMLIFFVLSGMRLNVPMLATAGTIGVCYFFVRIIGKYVGAYLGALVGHAPDEIRNYLGLALIPQAGVSIGLAALGQNLLPPELGSMLSTIILSSGILYEMVGPACAKASLFLSHSIPTSSTEPKEKETGFSKSKKIKKVKENTAKASLILTRPLPSPTVEPKEKEAGTSKPKKAKKSKDTSAKGEAKT